MKVNIGPRDKFPLMSDINMVPFIDISLVLLIIFMILSPILVSSQIKMNLPKAVTGVAPDADPIKIQITAKRHFYIDGQAVQEEALAGTLRYKIGTEKKVAILIEADKTVPFEFVVQAMDIAKQEGAQKLGVSVIPPTATP